MTSNAVVFAQPTPRFYRVLPPPRADLDETLAILFTGPCMPTKEDLKRTPLLIRRDVVHRALTWLKLNHIGYLDLEISVENLQSYSADEPPVAVVYRPADDGVTGESLPVYDSRHENGAVDGPCPFAVHGLFGEHLTSKTYAQKVAIALEHLRSGSKVLAYGHDDSPASTYNNPALYPGMFPWLFPYGLGGFANSNMKKSVPHATHVQWLLMYGDR
ncbi:hypothetical protein NEOLEDRAFT_1026735, partial [Neolentinus lepideus HHB14362 ss-1]